MIVAEKDTEFTFFKAFLQAKESVRCNQNIECKINTSVVN